jgi:hypothetical protein
VTSDPSVAPGVAAPVGTYSTDGTDWWIKVDSSSTSWFKVSAAEFAVWKGSATLIANNADIRVDGLNGEIDGGEYVFRFCVAASDSSYVYPIITYKDQEGTWRNFQQNADGGASSGAVGLSGSGWCWGELIVPAAIVSAPQFRTGVSRIWGKDVQSPSAGHVRTETRSTDEIHGLGVTAPGGTGTGLLLAGAWAYVLRRNRV